jgi:hypothetical protein
MDRRRSVTGSPAWYSASTTVTVFVDSVKTARETLTVTEWLPGVSGALHVAVAGFPASAAMVPPVARHS